MTAERDIRALIKRWQQDAADYDANAAQYRTLGATTLASACQECARVCRACAREVRALLASPVSPVEQVDLPGAASIGIRRC
jgi:anti-sigma-K factor RskA